MMIADQTVENSPKSANERRTCNGTDIIKLFLQPFSFLRKFIKQLTSVPRQKYRFEVDQMLEESFNCVRLYL